MYVDLMSERKIKELDIIKVVDISLLSEKENRGYNKAILIGIALSPDYIRRLLKNTIVDYTEYCKKEQLVDETAEWISNFLISRGFRAFAQSEKNLIHGCFDANTKTSLLPHKTIAIMAGLGWIGKNNLLVTEEYGCALCMCTILTDVPFPAENKISRKSNCSDCSVCQEICHAGAIHGTTWEPGMNRDLLVDVYHCDGCLKCLTNCIWTLKYIKKHIKMKRSHSVDY